MDRPWEGAGACVFDAYGTLFDVHSAVGRHRESLGERADAVSATWRTKQLEYTWLRSLMDRWEPFDTVTADALDYALDVAGLRDASLREQLLDAYLSLSCYPEVVTVLERLHGRGVQTAILSNGSRGMLDSAVAGAGIGGLLDAVLPVDDVRVFKPDPRVYRLAVEALGVPADSICFVSANGWDAAGAAAFGMRTAWVNRGGTPGERLPATPDTIIATLEPLGMA